MKRRTLPTSTRSLAPSAALSIGLHASLVLFVFLMLRGDATPMPPVYRINLVAAPPGPRAVGEVRSDPAPVPPAAPTPPAPSVEQVEKNPVRTTERTRRPTPAPRTAAADAPKAAPKAPVQRAGGGPTGGTGTDVANVATGDVEFPFPNYLRNIANQVLANFETSDPRPLSADIAFRILRNGSVVEITVRRSSGNRLFDISAMGAVEAAGRSRGFGPLPAGFGDDVLPVIFTFTPQMIR